MLPNTLKIIIPHEQVALNKQKELPSWSFFIFLLSSELKVAVLSVAHRKTMLLGTNTSLYL